MMFQLELELERWAARFSQTEALNSSDIEELVQHVRDSIANLAAKGLSEEEAFHIATMRVGEPVHVAREYSVIKGSPIWAQRAFWMLAGFLILETCSLSITAMASLATGFTASMGGGGLIMGCVSVVMYSILWIGLLVGIYRWSDGKGSRSLDGTGLSNVRINRVGLQILVVVAIAYLLYAVGTSTSQQFARPDDFGEAMLIAGYAKAISAVLVPVGMFIAMLTIRYRVLKSAAVE